MPFNHKQGHHQENSEKEQLEAYFLKLAISSKNNLEMAPKLLEQQFWQNVIAKPLYCFALFLIEPIQCMP